MAGNSSALRTKTARLAVLPVLGLALTGLTACEFTTGDKDSAKASPSVSASGTNDKDTKDKDAKADRPPATSDELTAALLGKGEIPAGYTVGDTTSDIESAGNPDDKVSDPKCAVLVANESVPGRVGSVSREYAKGSDSGAEVSMASAPHDALKKQFDAYVSALKACANFAVVNGNDSTEYAVSKVKSGVYGADSVSFTIDVSAEGTYSGTLSAAIALKGTTGITVMTHDATRAPDSPDAFAKRQIEKLAKAPAPASDTTPDPAPTERAQPTADQLTQGLLNAQEIPADYSIGETRTTPDPDTPTALSDPRCATVVDGPMASTAAAYVRRTYNRAPTSGGTGQEAFVVSLLSQGNAVLMQDFDTFVAALRACSSFTATADGAPLAYAVTDVKTGAYGANSVSYRISATGASGTAYAAITVAVDGTVGAQVGSISVAAPPAEQPALIRGQLAKLQDL